MAYTKKEIDKVFNDIIQDIEDGKALRTILKYSGMPSSSTFYIWIEEDEAKSKRYNKAIKSKIYTNNIKCNANPKGSKALGLNDYRNKNASKVNSVRYPNSSIYIFKIQDKDIYKIGVSQNITRRHRDISNSSPFNIDIIFREKKPDAYILENTLHNFFIDKHIKNEWFNLTELEIDECLNKIKEWKQVDQNIG
jgi:hypothetical protein